MSEVKNPDYWPQGTPENARSQFSGFNGVRKPTNTNQTSAQDGEAKADAVTTPSNHDHAPSPD